MRVFISHGVRVEPEVGQLVEHGLKGNPRLEPSEVLTEADVRPRAERDVLTGVAEDVEGVWVGIAVRVTVRAAQRHTDVGAGRDLRVTELRVGLRRPHDEQQRWLPAKTFL